MLYKSLILGILLSGGVFAAKSAVGVYYGLFCDKSSWPRLGGGILLAMIYAVIFAAAALILPRLDFMRHLDAIQAITQSAMLLHLTAAGLMTIWGILLLTQRKHGRFQRKAWWLLALPCPVCVTVIFFSMAFLWALFPGRPFLTAMLFYLGFLLIHLLTLALLHLHRHYANISPESYLGGGMLLLAAYFFLTVTVMPQFAGVEEVYRMACRPLQTPPVKATHAIPCSLFAALIFGAGYLSAAKKTRSLS